MNKDSSLSTSTQVVRQNSVGWMLKVLSIRLDSAMGRELKRLDLNRGQFAILMTLFEKEGLSQAEIGKKIVMPGYATTRNIDALEKKRFVERRKDDRSRRSYRIYITKQGHKIAPKLFEIVKVVNEGLLSDLNTTETKNLSTILHKMLQD